MLIARHDINTQYCIISSDKGYDGVIQSLQDKGIACQRFDPKVPPPTSDNLKQITNKENKTNNAFSALKKSSPNKILSLFTLHTATTSSSKKAHSKDSVSENEFILSWVNKLKLKKDSGVKDLPSSSEALNNYLKHNMKGEWSEAHCQSIYQALLRLNIIRESGKKIIWNPETSNADSDQIIIDKWVKKLCALKNTSQRSMPRSIPAFNNHLKSLMAKEWTQVRVEQICDVLTHLKITTIKEEQITWH